MVNDWYQRFVKPEASQKELVMVGRLSTLGLMFLAALMALALSNALQAFSILLQIGAGTGLVFILRWFWWRINAWTEISGMVISFIVALILEVIAPDLVVGHWKLVAGVAITTVGWLIVTMLTQPESEEVLKGFAAKVNPTIGWKNYRTESGETVKFPIQILGMFLGCTAVYSALFGTGSILYGDTGLGMGLIAVSVGCIAIILKSWKRY